MEGALKEAQAGLATALTAVGFTPAEAAKEGAVGTAASRRAAQEATLSELSTRMQSVEGRQQVRRPFPFARQRAGEVAVRSALAHGAAACCLLCAGGHRAAQEG